MNVSRALAVDAEYKASFLSSLMDNRKKVSAVAAEKIWRGFIKAAEQVERDCYERRVPVSIMSIKDVGMFAADKGLSLDSRDAEAFIGFNVNGDAGPELELGVKYRGLRRLLLSTELVKMLSSSLVFEVDEFTWKGEFALPEIRSNGLGTDVVAAYASAILYNGEIISVLLRYDDLMELERMDIDRAIQIYGNSSNSFYCSPWRNRMFEIAALKALYRKCADILDITSDINTTVFGSSAMVENL